jgi:two-component system, OmpR family, phosphate regulon response regulator PhoB
MTQKRVLVVDDDADVLGSLKTFLEDNGYQVATASDGDQAMQQVLANRPDLVTLDITMPNKSGVRVYREIKLDEQLKSIPVVVLTGVQHEFKQFISSRKQVPPPDGYLDKPVALNDLLAEVRRLIG